MNIEDKYLVNEEKATLSSQDISNCKSYISQMKYMSKWIDDSEWKESLTTLTKIINSVGKDSSKKTSTHSEIYLDKNQIEIEQKNPDKMIDTLADKIVNSLKKAGIKSKNEGDRDYEKWIIVGKTPQELKKILNINSPYVAIDKGE